MIPRNLKLAAAIVALTSLTLVGQHPTLDPKSDSVPVLDYGDGPMTPSIDHYYLEGDPDEFIPDEFMSNPSGEVDPRALKGHHFPPELKWVKIVGKNIVRAGETVRLEAQAESPVPIQRWFIAYQGPFGRRSAPRATFSPRKDNPWLHDGEVKTSKWTEPGVYIVYDGELNNELGHSKAFFPPMHTAMHGLEFTVLPNPDVDVMQPTLERIQVGLEENRNGAEFDIDDLIPVRATLADNKSGVAEATLRLSGPDNKYIEVDLQPRFNYPGEFVGYFKINPWSVGGAYVARTMQIEDEAGNVRDLFAMTDKPLGELRFTVRQDPAKVDRTPPELVSVAFDRGEAKMEEEVKIIAIAADDMSGVGDVVVDVGASPSHIDKKRVRLTPRAKRPLIKPGFDVEQNIYEGSFKTHALDEPGDWIVTRVFVRDRANNYLDMRSTEYPELANVKVVYGAGASAARSAGPSAATATDGIQAQEPQRIRRVDMIPPHPPRGPCLNCHEP